MKERVASHVAVLPKSGIRKFFDIVAQSKGIVSLGVGEPDFDTPWHISRAAGRKSAAQQAREKIRRQKQKMFDAKHAHSEIKRMRRPVPEE